MVATRISLVVVHPSGLLSFFPLLPSFLSLSFSRFRFRFRPLSRLPQWRRPAATARPLTEKEAPPQQPLRMAANGPSLLRFRSPLPSPSLARPVCTAAPLRLYTAPFCARLFVLLLKAPDSKEPDFFFSKVLSPLFLSLFLLRLGLSPSPSAASRDAHVPLGISRRWPLPCV